MQKKLQYIVGALYVLLLAPVTMAHPGKHGGDGFIMSWLHQLTSADHLLMVLAFCLFIGLIASSIRRY